jgi:signal transduction histidine kinase
MMRTGNRLRVLVIAGDESSRDTVHRSLEAAGISAEVLDARPDPTLAAEEDRRELLARERSARREAEAATCARDEFLATLSHELRTPLNAILGWARLIAEGTLDPRSLARAGAIIDRNARTEVQLIDDLLDMSRLVSGTFKLDVRLTELRPLLEDALDSVRPALTAKDIAIEFDASAAPRQLMCDGERVRQILWNFLSNAVKFTPRGGHVSLVATATDRSVAIVVRDSGAGIKPEFLPFVFERFRQQDAATTREQGGLGIGLAIAKHLAELHGGSVQASSEGQGKGATFILTLPQRDVPSRSWARDHSS